VLVSVLVAVLVSVSVYPSEFGYVDF